MVRAMTIAPEVLKAFSMRHIFSAMAYSKRAVPVCSVRVAFERALEEARACQTSNIHFWTIAYAEYTRFGNRDARPSDANSLSSTILALTIAPALSIPSIKVKRDS